MTLRRADQGVVADTLLREDDGACADHAACAYLGVGEDCRARPDMSAGADSAIVLDDRARIEDAAPLEPSARTHNCAGEDLCSCFDLDVTRQDCARINERRQDVTAGMKRIKQPKSPSKLTRIDTGKAEDERITRRDGVLFDELGHKPVA